MVSQTVVARPAGDRVTESGEGLLLALLWLVACALVLVAPLAAAAVFVLAGLLGLTLAARLSDLAAWGVISLVLAVLSLVDWVVRRRAQRREAKRQADLLRVVTRQRRAR